MGSAFYLLIACLAASSVSCEAKFPTLGEFASGEEGSGKVCLMRLGIPELSSPEEISFPTIVLNETEWNEARHAEIDSSEEHNYAGGEDFTGFLLDGRTLTVRALRTLVHSKGPIMMAVRKNLREAVAAFGFKTFSERIGKSRERISKFIFSNDVLGTTTDYKEKIGFIMRSGHSSSYIEAGVRDVRALETCQTNYLETELSYTGNLNTGDVNVVGHRVNVIFSGFNSTSDLYNPQTTSSDAGEKEEYLFRYSGFWKSNEWHDAESQRKTFLTYSAAKNLHLTAPLEVAPVGVFLTSYIASSAGPSTTILLWNGNRSRNYRGRSHTFGEEGLKFNMTSGPADTQMENRINSALTMNIAVFSDPAFDGAREKARKALENYVSTLDENNDTLELVLAGTALLTAIITVVCFGTSRLKILLRICLEVMDLVIGAVPGLVVLWRGLFRGNFRIGPAALVTRIIPAQFMKQSNVRQTLDGKVVHAFYLPVFITECTAVAFRRSPDRTWFIVAYSLGIALGVFILIFQLWYYMRVRRVREASIYPMEDPELPELSEGAPHDQFKPRIRSLLILRRSCRKLRRLRLLQKTRTAHEISAEQCDG